ncbi:hypothetical protein KCU98_g8670, partial [Aureobasidium melanogenum]
MGQMDDSASDTSHDKVKTAFYKISPEEMCKMKHSLEIMENRLGSLWITTGRAHVDPILNEFELVKASITEAEPASENLITPETSDSDSDSKFDSDSDSDSEPEKPAPAACTTLVKGGVILVVSRMVVQLKTQKNESSAYMADFIDKFVKIDDEHELLDVIEQAMRADSDFVKEFGIRTKKILSEFFTRKIKDAFSKELTEAFSKI